MRRHFHVIIFLFQLPQQAPGSKRCRQSVGLDALKCYYTRRLNIHHTVLYYSTGKLAPEKVIVVVPLEQVRKEGSRVSFHCEPQWIGIVQYCVVDI